MLYYGKKENSKVYSLYAEKCNFSHKNHEPKDVDKILFLTKEIKDYIDEKIIQKKHSPSILLDFINDRFKTNIGYKEILNYISKKNKSLFGNSSEEFSNFINL